MSSQKHKYWKCFQNYTTYFALKTQDNGKNYTFPTLFSVFHSLSLHTCCLEVRFDRHFCFTCKRTWALLYLSNANLQLKLWYENKSKNNPTPQHSYVPCIIPVRSLLKANPPGWIRHRQREERHFCLGFFFFREREFVWVCVLLLLLLLVCFVV